MDSRRRHRRVPVRMEQNCGIMESRMYHPSEDCSQFHAVWLRVVDGQPLAIESVDEPVLDFRSLSALALTLDQGNLLSKTILFAW